MRDVDKEYRRKNTHARERVLMIEFPAMHPQPEDSYRGQWKGRGRREGSSRGHSLHPVPARACTVIIVIFHRDADNAKGYSVCVFVYKVCRRPWILPMCLDLARLSSRLVWSFVRLRSFRFLNGFPFSLFFFPSLTL